MNEKIVIVICLISPLVISCAAALSPNYYKFINKSSHTVYVRVGGMGGKEYVIEPGKRKGFPATHEISYFDYTPADKVEYEEKSGSWYDQNFGMVRNWWDITFYDQ
jgi:hypothetical protein